MERVNTNGTSLRGHFQMPYAKLVDLIGEPNDISDGYKTDVEWAYNIGLDPFDEHFLPRI